MEAESTDKQLKKELTFVQLLFLSLGGIIGSGWLFAVLDASGFAGPAVVISWVIGGILVLFIALTYAEVSGMIPKSGAIVRYPHYSHGSYTGFTLGWAYLLSAVTVPTIEAEAVVGYAANELPFLTVKTSTLFGTVHVLTVAGIAFAMALLVFFFFVNYIGIRFLGKFNQYIVYWKIIIPVVTFLLLFIAFKGSNFSNFGGFAPEGFAPVFLAIPSAGIVFAFLGFRQALEFGGEAKRPQKDIPRATILSVVIGVVIYVLLQLSFTGAISWPSAGLSPGDWTGLSGSIWSNGPLLDALKSTGIPLLGAFSTVLLVDAWVSPSGTGWIYLGTSTRVLYGMSTDGYFPKSFLTLSNSKIPWIALLASVIVGFIFLLPFPSWYLLVGFISSATVFTYIMGGVTLTVFRKTAPGLKRPFTLPASKLFAPLGFVAALLIVYWSGYVLETFLVFAIVFGLPLYMMYSAPKKFGISRARFVPLGIAFWVISIGLFMLNYLYVLVPSVTNLGLKNPIAAPSSVFLWFPLLWVALVALVLGTTVLLERLVPAERRRDIRSGYWLMGLILSLMPMSFYGAFGPYLSVSQSLIPFPYDNFVAIVVGLVFYYFAIKSGFQTEDIVDISKEAGAHVEVAAAGGK